MDAVSTRIVDAADRVAADIEGQHCDRWYAELGSNAISCSAHEMSAGRVTIEHRPRHPLLKTDGVMVERDQPVVDREALDLVGSRIMLYLHIAPTDPLRGVIDPYAPESLQDETWWYERGSLDVLSGLCRE